VADFVEICNVCARKVIIEAAKRIINSDKVCYSYSDLNFGVTFFGTQCRIYHFHTKEFHVHIVVRINCRLKHSLAHNGTAVIQLMPNNAVIKAQAHMFYVFLYGPLCLI